MISWMLYTVALSLLIAGAAYACSQLCALFRIPTRWCWMAALLCSIAAPFVARSVPARVQGNALRVTAATYRVIQTVSDASPLPASTATSGVIPVTQTSTVMVAWAIASGAFLLALIAASTRLRVARRSWSRETVCGERVLISHDTGPAVVGLFRHEIVLPAWALELSDAELTLAVTHEREHVLARDPWVLLAALLVVALAPWNPVLWFQLRGLRRSVEGDCDARVLAHTRDARSYAALLIAVGERRNNVRVPVLALSYPTSILEWRIRTMTNRTPSHRSARAVAYTVLIGALATTVLLLPRPGMSQGFAALSVPAERAGADTGRKAASDSALSTSLAATRDTLATIRKRMHIEPGVLYHVTFRNGRVISKTLVPRTSVFTVPQPNFLRARIDSAQTAIALRFPDAAAATPDHNRVFAFILDSAGRIEQADAGTSESGAIRGLTGTTNAGNFSSLDVLKNVPVGSDSVSVIWMVRK